jgi:hypothetical protein
MLLDRLRRGTHCRNGGGAERAKDSRSDIEEGSPEYYEVLQVCV